MFKDKEPEHSNQKIRVVCFDSEDTMQTCSGSSKPTEVFFLEDFNYPFGTIRNASVGDIPKETIEVEQ